jgi:hypothetical protein
MRSWWIFAMTAAVVGALMFYAPIFYAMPHWGGMESHDEARIFFIEFFVGSSLFWAHAGAVAVSFVGFVCATLSLAREAHRLAAVIALIISLAVIVAYLLGYEQLFGLIG